MPIDDHDDVDRLSTAIHEAGHAVLARALGIDVVDVNLTQGDDHLGKCRFSPDSLQCDWYSLVEEGARVSRIEVVFQACLVMLAGPVAEERHAGSMNWGGAGLLPVPDPDRPGEHFYLIRRTGDFDYVIYIADQFAKDSREAEAFHDWLDLQVKALVQFHWDPITRVADALVTANVLTGTDLDSLLLPERSAATSGSSVAADRGGASPRSAPDGYVDRVETCEPAASTKHALTDAYRHAAHAMATVAAELELPPSIETGTRWGGHMQAVVRSCLESCGDHHPRRLAVGTASIVALYAGDLAARCARDAFDRTTIDLQLETYSVPTDPIHDVSGTRAAIASIATQICPYETARRSMLRWLDLRTKAVLERNWEFVSRLADQLARAGRMSAAEVIDALPEP